MRLLFCLLLLSLPLQPHAQSLPDSTAVVAAATAPHPAAPLAPALPDTLPPSSAPDTALTALQQLPPAERELRGRDDAKRYFRPSRAVLWGSFGVGLLTPPTLIITANPAVLFPLGGVAAVGALGPKPARIQASAPQPELLRDEDYRRGYERKASNKKISRALVGYGAGAAVSMAAITTALIILFSGGIGFGG